MNKKFGDLNVQVEILISMIVLTIILAALSMAAYVRFKRSNSTE